MTSPERPADPITVPIDGHRVRLSNLTKVLYPASGFTKGEVIDYLHRIAPTLLPHLAGKPVTRVRCPDGIARASFFEKHRPAGVPDWVPTGRVTGSGATIDYPVVDSLAALLVLGNLASLELHVPQWRFPARGHRDLATPPPVENLVVDLDPDPDLDFARVVLVAQLVGGLLTTDGLTPFVRTSGGKGLQVYAPVRAATSADTTAYCARVAARLAEVAPTLITRSIARDARRGRVLVDVNQNQPGRTMIAPYSPRARETDAGPTVAAPLDWEELEGLTDRRAVWFSPAEVLRRVERHGDLAAGLLPASPRDRLPGTEPTR